MRRSRPASCARSVGGQLRQERLLLLDEVGHRRVDDVAARRRQAHEHPAPVARVGAPVDEPAALEPVDAVGHRARRDERLLDELAGRELIGLACAAQGREHVEGPAVEQVLREGRPAGQVEPARQPRDPGEHLQRRHVEVGALPAPGRDDLVDVVGGPAVGAHAPIVVAIKTLDIKRNRG